MKTTCVFGGVDLVDQPIRVLTGPGTRSRATCRRSTCCACDAISPNPSCSASSAFADQPQRHGEEHRTQSQQRPHPPRAERRAAASRWPGGAAARLAADGKEVLVVSFNSTLPHYLRELVDKRCLEINAPNRLVTTIHLHGLCKRAIDGARLHGYQPTSGVLPGTLHAWEEQVEKAIDAYRGIGGPTFDAVLVDEGQDFSLKWWNFLREHVVRPGGEMLPRRRPDAGRVRPASVDRRGGDVRCRLQRPVDRGTRLVSDAARPDPLWWPGSPSATWMVCR
ncbi:MAG: hypothetical protein R2713_12440 [Ilumatobacteraceae bacterium]